MDISVTIIDFELRFYVCIPNTLLEGNVSQNFDLGRLNFGTFFPHKFLHFTKLILGPISKF